MKMNKIEYGIGDYVKIKIICDISSNSASNVILKNTEYDLKIYDISTGDVCFRDINKQIDIVISKKSFEIIKNFGNHQMYDEYKIFVMQASLNDQKIECRDLRYNKWCSINMKEHIQWNWVDFNFRVKLPEGLEYVYYGDWILFRSPKIDEWFLTGDRKSVV